MHHTIELHPHTGMPYIVGTDVFVMQICAHIPGDYDMEELARIRLEHFPQITQEQIEAALDFMEQPNPTSPHSKHRYSCSRKSKTR